MHHGSNKHLASDDEPNLDCCEVIVIIVDYDMAIITLPSIYIVLSCRLTPLMLYCALRVMCEWILS
jgi:hypothetical protein